MPIGAVMAQKIFADSDLFDDIHCQSFVIYWNSVHGMFDHLGNFIIQNQLTKIEGHSHVDHA